MKLPIAILVALTSAAVAPNFFLNGREVLGDCLFAGEDTPPQPEQEQPEVLTRGPVHEAFAEPVTLQTLDRFRISRQPPANIEEVPPADRPQGDQFTWVPGYWGWDADRDDFIWVSACWRAGPPNMYWVPGYWARINNIQEVGRSGVDVQVGGFGVHVGGSTRTVEISSWTWVSGFWNPTTAQEIEYLTAPPPLPDVGAPGPAPAIDQVWVPGCWYWQNGQYVLRSGYWQRQQQNWIWEPSHYRWTPRGYVFVAGHWDYPLERRGVLFAPVYFSRTSYSRAGFSYSPSIAINLGVLASNLFSYPRYSHYYFGDYYDDAYLSAGIYPQFESERRHTWYDPIYTYDRWYNGRNDEHWDERQRQRYDSRRSDKNLRPAHTYREMEFHAARMPEAQRGNATLARPFNTITENKASPLKYERMDTHTRQGVAQQANDVHKFSDERVKWERVSNPQRATSPVADTVNSPSPVRKPTMPPAEHSDADGATLPTKTKDTAIPPTGRQEPATRPVEHTEPATPPVERAETPPAGNASPHSREYPMAQLDRVKLPVAPPVVGKTGGTAQSTPPNQPVEERATAAPGQSRDSERTGDKDRGRMGGGR